MSTSIICQWLLLCSILLCSILLRLTRALTCLTHDLLRTKAELSSALVACDSEAPCNVCITTTSILLQLSGSYYKEHRTITEALHSPCTVTTPLYQADTGKYVNWLIIYINSYIIHGLGTYIILIKCTSTSRWSRLATQSSEIIPYKVYWVCREGNEASSSHPYLLLYSIGVVCEFWTGWLLCFPFSSSFWQQKSPYRTSFKKRIRNHCSSGLLSWLLCLEKLACCVLSCIAGSSGIRLLPEAH